MIRFPVLIKALTRLYRQPTPRYVPRPISPFFMPHFNFSSSNAHTNPTKAYQNPKFLLHDDPNLSLNDYQAMLSDFGDVKDLSKQQVLEKLRVLYKLGHLNYDQKNMTEALRYYGEAFSLANSARILDTLELAYLYNGTANICIAQNEPEEAGKHLKKAEEIFSKLGASEDTSTQVIKNIYLRGIVHEKKDEHDKAVQLLNEALNKANALPKGDIRNANTLMLIHDVLGFVYQKMQSGENALKSWKKGLELAIEKHGKDSNEAKMFNENLAWLAFYENKLDEALSYAQACLGPGKKDGKDEDYRSHSCINLLANIHLKKEEFDKAIEHYNRALKLLEKSPEKEHDKIGNIDMLLAECYFLKHDDKQANAAFEKAVKSFSEAYGAESNRVAEAFEAWGDLLKNNVIKMEQAKSAYLKTLSILDKGDKKNAHRLLKIYSFLGELAYYDEKYEEAEKLFKACLELPSDQVRKSPQMEEVFSFLGNIYTAQNKYPDNIECYKKAIERSEDLAKGNANLDFHMRNMAAAYEKVNELGGAEETYRKALEFAMSRYGKEDETTQRIVNHLLDVLKKQDRVQEYKDIRDRYSTAK